MAANLARLLQHLRHLAAASAALPASDAELLERFRARRDEEAFAALVARHGPMVRRLCGRILANTHDAEDAFQATFLVLARKAAVVRPPTLAASRLAASSNPCRWTYRTHTPIRWRMSAPAKC